jgi:hypothetical protein
LEAVFEKSEQKSVHAPFVVCNEILALLLAELAVEGSARIVTREIVADIDGI